MNYWVVGARWDGIDVRSDFYKQGSWGMGWTEGDHPEYDQLKNQIREGDRIAIKKRNGRGADTITIEALGIVKDVENGVVFVNWLVTGLKRRVGCKNYLGTIHGPLPDDAWRNEAFSI